MLIVTAATPDYLQGAHALHNSIERNSPGHDVMALLYGCKSDRIGWMPGPIMPAPLPTSELHVSNDAMYCRLELPSMFPDDERVLWMDCDQIVTKPLDELETIPLNGYPCAMVPTSSGTGNSGLIVMDVNAWREQKVTERCYQLMRNPGGRHFDYVVQSVLNYVLRGEFQRLENKWQGIGNRSTTQPEKHHVIHWCGRLGTPWRPQIPLHNQGLWDEYGERCETS